MKLAKIGHKVYFNLLSAIQIQVFVTLLALPILVFWGLPISTLTIFGNILFAPVLTLFLLLSSIIFFFELMYIPNEYFIYLLEQLSSFWMRIVPANPKSYFIAFPQGSWFIFVIGFITVITTILYLKTSRSKQTILLGLILFSSCIFAKLPFWINTNKLTLKHRTQNMCIYCCNGEVTIHDYGALNYYCGTESWIKYTLAPALAKTFGTLQIKKLHIHKPVKSTGKNLGYIKNSFDVQRVIVQTTKLPRPVIPDSNPGSNLGS